MQKLDRNTLSIIGSFLELCDISICCRLLRSAKYMYVGVVHAKITEDFDVINLAKCPNICSLIVERNLDEDEMAYLSRLAIKRIKLLIRVNANGDFKTFAKLEYLEADNIRSANHPNLSEIKYRSGNCPVPGANIKRISGAVEDINYLLRLDPEQKLPFVSITQNSRNQTHADMLSKYNLEHVTLYTDPTKFIKPCLRSLELHECEVPDLCDTSIEQLTLVNIKYARRYPRKLKILVACSSNIDMSGLIETTISDLSLNQCKIANEDLLRMLRLKKLRLCFQSSILEFAPDYLIELRFTGLFLSKIEMKYIPASVTSLYISCASAAFDILPPNLTKLHCRDVPMNIVKIEKIATLPLDSLELINCELTNHMLSLLAPLKLQHLDIRENKNITAKGARSILHMPLRTLEHDKISILKVL